jgi:phosphoribosylanthranilate isomerase
MSHFQIKVCGITRPQDAELCAELGVDMIGMIFHSKSKRHISIAKAREITKLLLPVVDRVGVLVDAPVSDILRTAEKCGLTYAQLHGACLVRDIRRLQSEGLKVIQAFSGDGSKLVWALNNSPADLVMIDNSRGTAKPFSPSGGLIKALPNFVLSGSVSESNVRAGVKAYAPLVVDVNSSVETSPGTKSREKLKRFIGLCNEIRYGK